MGWTDFLLRLRALRSRTRAGRRQLREEESAWRKLTAAVGRVLSVRD